MLLMITLFPAIIKVQAKSVSILMQCIKLQLEGRSNRMY